jgi:hypothetical protein
MPHDGIGPDLPFFDKKMQPGQDALGLGLWCFDE